MKSKIKQLLVGVLAVAVISSNFVAALIPNAATITGTIAVTENKTVVASTTDTTVDVPVKVTFKEAVTGPHGRFSITADGATLTNVKVDSFDNANAKENPDAYVRIGDEYGDDGTNLETGTILVESAIDNKAAVVTYINLVATFTVPANTDAGTVIPVTVKGIDATNANEDNWEDLVATNGKITVEADEPECEHVNVTLEYSTIENGDTYTCITKEVCNDCNEYENIIAELDSMKYNHTLTLQSDLTIKFLHAESTGWTNYSDCYMSFVKEVYDASGAIIDYRNDTISDYIVNGGYMTVDYKGVSAKEMGDIIHAKTFGKDAEGRVILLAAEEYSIKEYTDNQFPKTTTAIVKLKPLLVNLLNYGAAAQVNFEYNSANLVNADLTDELKALAVSERTYVSVKDFDNAFYPENDIFSRSLVLKNAVEVNLILKKSELKKIITDEDYSDLNIVVEYETTSGSKSYANYSIADETIQPNSTSYYVASFRDITAANMSTAFVASVYDGETYLGNTTYSIESYTASYYNSADENLANLVKALTAYGDAAAAYLKS